MAMPLLFEDDVLKLLFQAVSISVGTPPVNIAQNHATTPAASYYVSLLTADPSTVTAPDQLSKEAVYTGYARVAVPRTTGGWNVANGMVAPINIITFGTATAVAQTFNCTYFGLGTAATGAGRLLAFGKLVPPISISTGVAPRIDNNPTASRIPSDWV